MGPVLLSIDGGEENEEDDDEDEETPGITKAYRRVLRRCLAISPSAIEALVLLSTKTTPGVLAENEDLLVTLAAYTEPSQPWVPSKETSGKANQLLRDLLAANNTTQDQFIVQNILQHHLRPLFSKSKPSSITSSGRKVEYVDPSAGRGEGIPDDSNETKPWKFSDFRAFPLASYCVNQADETLIAKQWALFLPVLLTLTDDSTTLIRLQGLQTLTTFLRKFPAKTLHDTGLSKVFEDAIFPTLSYLPSLTPEAESIQLLTPAFEALQVLASKQLPSTTSTSPSGSNKEQIKVLDKLLREGVFTAYFHAKYHVRIVKVLCEQTVLILNTMGIYAVKHLKDLIPMLSSILSDPFAPAAPATLLSATKALLAVLANCWPRIPDSPWQDEITQAIVLCWLNVREGSTAVTTSSSAAIRHELLTTVKCLSAVLKAGGTNLAEVAKPLVDKEPALRELFSPSG
ncbi:hypothetical protein B0T14DRAFT_423769 [Immersiella caudata]|uniref:Uncharacterized protein n=1 Tax=Immersiella caudata TaxID=314043 RepID=A0AA39X5K3_9PEZI|nr:hypothetical protein B0T14DRAFT_423769 [Immersiella caudata]